MSLQNQIDFKKLGGLVPVITQDEETGDVLMMAYMNLEAFEETLRTGRACYYSRSRNCLWRKGEESGNVQKVQSVHVDCDADTLLIRIKQVGDAACHKGYRSCFFRAVEKGKLKITTKRVFDPATVYGNGKTK